MKIDKRKCFLLLNIIIPLGIGSMIYYVASPGITAIKLIDAFIDLEFYRDNTYAEWFTDGIFRNYFPDFLWAYSLVFSLFLLVVNNTAGLLQSFIIAFTFAVTMEGLQLTAYVKGTFDLWDILVELFAQLIAVFIIKHKMLKED